MRSVAKVKIRDERSKQTPHVHSRVDVRKKYEEVMLKKRAEAMQEKKGSQSQSLREVMLERGKGDNSELSLQKNLDDCIRRVLDTSRREEIMMSRLLKKGDTFYMADLYLPEGCKALEMPKSTVIEIKKRALFDTVSQQLDRYKELGGENGKIKLYILAIETLDNNAEMKSPHKKNGYNRGFEVTSIDELRNKIVTQVETIRKGY